MEESILVSVKEMLGVPSEYEAFDSQLIMHINSVFAILSQIGVGNSKFMISDEDNTWDEYLETEDDLDLEDVKSYMYLKVKMMFDPPSSGSASDAFKQQIAEFEWRINAEADDWE